MVGGLPPKIGVLRDFFFEEAEADVARVTDHALEKLAKSGADVANVGLPPSFAAIHAAHLVVEQTEIADAQADKYADGWSRYRPAMRESIEVGSLVPAASYVRAQRVRQAFRSEIVELLTSFDVLATPTTIGGAPSGLLSIGDWSFQSPWSASGLPSLTLPSGLSLANLPLGMQLVAAPFQESVLLSAGAWCQAILGPLGVPPRFRN
jgi:aspartyl-tRNA(Asn)/glutamyl-tRNA(Gln) amidotransferase subunit A